MAFYHSDVPAEEKEIVHNSWLNDDIKIIVATTAFGMGIDKPGLFSRQNAILIIKRCSLCHSSYDA